MLPHRCVCAGTLALLVFVSGQTLSANEELRPMMTRVASVVAQIMRTEGFESITVGEISGPPSFATTAGLGMKNLLIEEFKKIGIVHKPIGTPVGLKGEFRPLQDDFGAIDLTVSLMDRFGQVLTNLSTDIDTSMIFDFAKPPSVDAGKVTFPGYLTGTDVMSELLGANVVSRVRDGIQVLSAEDVMGSFSKPTAELTADGGVRAARNSPFSLRLIVNGEPQAIQLESGFPFLQLKEGDTFEIQLRNESPLTIAATFTLDGLNSFALSEVRHPSGEKAGSPRYTRYIIQPRGQVTLKGWHKNNEEVTRFQVTKAGESAAALLGKTENLGVITVKCQATWFQGQTAPRDEPRRYFSHAAPELGIGEGRRTQQRVREETRPREYGVVRSVISVRYTK